MMKKKDPTPTPEIMAGELPKGERNPRRPLPEFSENRRLGAGIWEKMVFLKNRP
ncbi:MAG: hypothetical protein CM15mP1_1880 [Methanobacteriota archaeon]|nr:MAG: hypothetical protein CM15mP1_1880 [Euryarchaeota archaeon]